MVAWCFVRNCFTVFIPSIKPGVKDAGITRSSSSPDPAPFSMVQVIWKVPWRFSEEEEQKVRRDKAEYSNNCKAFSTWSERFFLFFFNTDTVYTRQVRLSRTASSYITPTLQLQSPGLISNTVEEPNDSTEFLIFKAFIPVWSLELLCTTCILTKEQSLILSCLNEMSGNCSVKQHRYRDVTGRKQKTH